MTPDSSVPILAGWWGGLLFGPSCRFIPTAGVAVQLPFPDHVVVGPHYAREICAPAPPHRIEVAVCVSGSSWLGG